MMITEPAPAKINLALHVRRKRADGYHDIETLFAFCADGDEVRVEDAAQDNFTITGPFAAALNSSPERGGGRSGDQRHAGGMSQPRSRLAERAGAKLVEGQPQGQANLVMQAADAFRQAFAIEATHAITLDKHLPIASGIGGGSADAAATLRALARFHDIPVDDQQLVSIASSLGADVPACLFGLTALGTGKGDSLQPLPGMPRMPVLLVNPRVGVPTAAVFSTWDGIDRGGIAEGGVLTRARTGRNDLESPARQIAPVIGDVLDALIAAPGATLVRMSGSGATCFALFDDERHRDAAATQATARGWWTLATTLG